MVKSGAYANRRKEHFWCIFDPRLAGAEIVARVGNIGLPRDSLRRLMPARWQPAGADLRQDLWLDDDVINSFLSVLPVRIAASNFEQFCLVTAVLFSNLVCHLRLGSLYASRVSFPISGNSLEFERIFD